MNQTRVIIGLGIIIIAMIAIRMDVLLWTFQVGGINLKIYPAYGLAVIGGLMVLKKSCVIKTTYICSNSAGERR